MSSLEERRESLVTLRACRKALRAERAAHEATIERARAIIARQKQIIERLHVFPPVLPPVLPPPSVPDGWSRCPERVDPVKPTTTHVDCYPGNVYVIDGQTFTGSPAAAHGAIAPHLNDDETVVIGIHDDCGVVEMGFGWSATGGRLFRRPTGVRAALVGKTPDAEVSVRFLGKPNGPEGDAFDAVDEASFFDLGIRGLGDSFIIRQSGYVRHLTFDTFWMLNNVNAWPGQYHSSGFHLHRDWETMTLKGYQARGLGFTNHTFYLKPGGFWQVLDCELWGGNRTGFQARPHPTPINPDMSATPHGAAVIDGNFADDFARNHGGASGGQWMTVWASLEHPVRISNNRCEGARYGCLGVVQSTTGNALLTDDGYAHRDVYVWGNQLDNTGGDRDCAVFAGVDRVHFGPGNEFGGSGRAMCLGNDWSLSESEARDVRKLLIYGTESLPKFGVWKLSRANPEWHQFSSTELAAMVV